MILGFKTKWPDGRPTHFVEKIQACFKHEKHLDNIPKIHTFRKGNRWRVGRWIQFATGVRTPKYHCLVESQCMGVQDAEIEFNPLSGELSIHVYNDPLNPTSSEILSKDKILLFAVNDGFDSLDDMIGWFFPSNGDSSPQTILGQIIHFTDFKY